MAESDILNLGNEAASVSEKSAASGAAQYWPAESEQFGRLLDAASSGTSQAAIVVGPPGRGKSRLLGALIDEARAAGHVALHVHVDRYFTPAGLAGHVSQRLIELHPQLTLTDAVSPSADPEMLPQLLAAVDVQAQVSQVATVLAFSGLNAHLDAPANLDVFGLVSSLLEQGRRQLRNCLTLVELRSGFQSSKLERLARSGLLHFPVGEPAEKLIDLVLSSHSTTGLPFSPAVRPVAAARARGNLHVLRAAMRSIASRAEAAGLAEIGPVEWEALGTRTIADELEGLALPRCNALLSALVDWPAGGYIALADLERRLQIENAIATPEEFAEQLLQLREGAPVLELVPQGDPPHLRFQWPELRSALSRSRRRGVPTSVLVLRRRLQAQLIEAGQAAQADDPETALRLLQLVVADSEEEELETFRLQAAALAVEIWQGHYSPTIAQRVTAAHLLRATEGQRAIRYLVVGLSYPDSELRQVAEECLCEIGAPAAGAVASLLAAPDVELQLVAIRLLGRISSGEAFDALERTLTAEASVLRLAALEALTALADKRAGRAVATCLSDSEAEVRIAALAAISSLGYTGAVDAVGALLIDESSRVREAAADTLTALGHRDAVPALMHCLADARPQLQEAAARALVTFGENARVAVLDALGAPEVSERLVGLRGLRFFPRSQSVPPIVGCLRDEDREVVEAAAERLVEFGSDAVSPVAELLADRRDRVREDAGHVLARIGEPAVAVVQGALADREPLARAAAARTLGEMRHEASLGVLTRAAADEDSRVRLAVVRALVDLGTEEALEPIVLAMADADSRVAALASDAVAHLGDRALNALLNHLGTTVAGLGEAVAAALATIPAAATPALVQTLSHDTPPRQAAAVQALQRIAAPEAAGPVLELLDTPAPVGEAAREFALHLPGLSLPALVEKLCAERSELRRVAADTCVALGASGLQALVEVLTTGEEVARVAALDALALSGAEVARGPIVEATLDESGTVRIHAASALGLVRTADGLSALCRLIADTDAEVRSAAANSLLVHGRDALTALIDYYSLRSRLPEPIVTLTLRAMGDAAVGGLMDLARSQPAHVRAGAINCLVALEHQDLLDLLPGLMGDLDDEVRGSVRAAVRRFGPEALPYVLRGFLGDSAPAEELGRECLALLGEASVQPLVDLLLDFNSPFRVRAITALAQVGSATCLEPLVQVMAERDDSVRVPAQDTIVSFGKEAIPILLDHLDDPNPVLRESVVVSLGRMTDLALPAILDVLTEPPDSRRAMAIRVLRSMEVADGVPLVVDLIAVSGDLGEVARDYLTDHVDLALPLLGDKLASQEASLRDAAVDLMVSVGEPAVQTLANAAVDSPMAGRMAALRGLETLGGDTARLAVSIAATDPEAQVRALAVQILVRMGDLAAAAPLVNDEDRSVCEAAVEALSDHGILAVQAILDAFEPNLIAPPAQVIRALSVFGDVAAQALLTRLSSPTPLHRAGAVSCLCALGHTDTFPQVASLLADPDQTVQQTVADGLVRTGANAVAALVCALTTGDQALVAPAGDCLERLGDCSVPPLLAAAEDRTVERRDAAIDVIARINPVGCASHFVGWLRNNDERMRVAAANALKTIHDEAAIPDLLDGIDGDTEPSRDARLQAICSFGEVAVPLLLERMEDPAWASSPALARALATLGDVVEEAILELLTDKRPERRLLAARTLLDMKVERAAPQLLALVVDENSEVRAAAALALAALPTHLAVPLLDGLRNPSRDVAKLYMAAVAAQSEEFLDIVAEHLEDSDPAMRAGVILALGRVRRDADFAPLKARLRDEVPQVRIAATWALSRFRSAEAAVVLLDALADPEERVYEAIVSALHGLGAVAHPLIVQRLVTEADELDARVAHILELPEATGMSLVRGCLTSSEPQFRVAAARALGHLGSGDDAPAIAELLSDGAAQVREAAAGALLRIGESSLPYLLQHLQRGEPDSIDLVRQTLVAFGQAAVDPLTGLLPAADATARCRAIETLCEIGDPLPAPEVLDYLSDPADDVRIAAARALQRFRYAPAIATLLQNLDSETAEVREAKAEVVVGFGALAVPNVLEDLDHHGWSGERQVVAILRRLKEPAAQQCVEMLSSEEHHLRWMAVKALGLLDTSAHVTVVAPLLADEDAQVREAALATLSVAGKAGAAAAALCLEDPEVVRRQRVSRALVELGDVGIDAAVRTYEAAQVSGRLGIAEVVALSQRPGDLPVLSALLQDSSTTVRLSVCDTLAEWQTPDCAAMLVQALHDPEPKVADRAVEGLKALGEVGGEALATVLVEETGPADGVLLTALTALGEPALTALHSYLERDDVALRTRTIEVLMRVKQPASMAPLAGCLGDSAMAVRVAAEEALAEFGAGAVSQVHAVLLKGIAPACGAAGATLARIGLAAVSALVQGIAGSPVEARVEAIRALADIGDAAVAPQVTAHLTDPEAVVRAAAAGAVQRFRYLGALPQLIEGIGDEDTVARGARVDAICSFGAASVPLLLERLEDPQYAQVAALHECLARLEDVSHGVVLGMLSDEAPTRRALAARVLERMKPEDALAPLAATVLDPDEQVRMAAARALRAYGTAGAQPLLDHFATSDPVLREYYARALSVQGDEVLDLVAHLLSDGNVETRLAALQTLSYALRPADQGTVETCLVDDDLAVRCGACSALARFGNRQAAEALVEALGDSQEAVFDAAVEAMGALGDVAYEVLVPRLVRENGELDERIVRAMAVAGDAAAPVLRECLTRDSVAVRAAAARALFSVAGAEAAEDFLALLDDPAEPVRQVAVDSLQQIGPSVAGSALDVLRAGKLPGALSAADLLGQLQCDIFDDVLPILRSPEAGARAGAARLLGSLGDERATAHLVVRLKDSAAEVRAEAAGSLGLLGAVTAIAHLVGALEDPDGRVAKAAIAAFARIGEPAVDGLVSRILTPDGTVRDDVVFALAGIGEAAVEPLLRASNGQQTDVTVAALRALTIIGGEKAAQRLVAALYDPLAAVRAEASQGVRAIGRAAVPVLVASVRQSAAPDGGEALVAALADLREAALPEVVALLENNDERLRNVGAEVLGRMGMVAAPVLRRALGHSNPAVRTLAARGVAHVGDVSLVPDLIDLLEDQDTGVVAEAIHALADLGDARGATPIVRCVGATSPAIREALDYALPVMGPAVALPLTDLLTSEDPLVVQQATTALRRLGRPAETALVGRLNSELPAMRVAAARVLGVLDSHAVIDPLAEHLSDPDDEVQCAVADALGALGGPAVAPVLDRLTDPDPRVSTAVLLALRAMTVDPIYSLMERARDADEKMRFAAVRMAGRYGREEAVPTLQQRLQDTSLAINREAAIALGEIGTERAIRVLAENAITPRLELAQVILELLRGHPSLAIPILVRLAARPEGPPDPDYASVATDLARSAPGIVDELLADPEEPVRRAAAVILGDIGDSQSLRALVRKARDPDVAVRKAAAVALGRMGTEAVRPLAALLGDPELDVRRAAADVLATIEHGGAELLVQQLNSSDDTALKALVCTALGRSTSPRAVSALREAMQRESDELVQVSAAAGLARLGHPDGLTSLETALHSPDDDTRGQAAEALADLGGTVALSLVSLIDDSSDRVREAVTRAFRHLSADEIPMLYPYIHHPDPQVRTAVACALREVPRDPQALRLLLGMLRDENEGVCSAAIESLPLFGDTAMEALSEDALSGDAERRYAACWALGQLGPQAVDTLVLLARQDAPDARSDAFRALGRIGDPRGREAVLAGLQDPAPKVRVAAVGALRRLATGDDALVLVDALADADTNVRMVAASVAPALMTGALRQGIVGLLQHDSADVRAAAAQVLRQDGHPSAAPALRKAAAREPEAWVAEMMEAAAEAITG
jgi:HEAT repeat protein